MHSFLCFISRSVFHLGGMLWIHTGLWRDVSEDLESAQDFPQSNKENGELWIMISGVAQGKKWLI